jgi:hypothetical protein
MRRAPLLLALLLLAGCENRRGPRQPPFPVFDPRQPFALAEAAPAPGSQEVTAFSAVSLGGRFAARVPQRFDEWGWGADTGRTLLLHRTAGRVDALVYAEPFGDRMTRQPTAELGRFRLLLAGPALAFRRSPGTFTGWKWIGRNANGVEIRLARASGTWGPAKSPALLVFGTASLGESFGVHLAIVCEASPGCAQAEDLARLLDSIQVPPGSMTTGGETLEDLARQAGLRLPARR